MIFRTSNPVVVKHFVRLGARVTCVEEIPKAGTHWRFLMPPAAFDAWMDKLPRFDVKKGRGGVLGNELPVVAE